MKKILASVLAMTMVIAGGSIAATAHNGKYKAANKACEPVECYVDDNNDGVCDNKKAECPVVKKHHNSGSAQHGHHGKRK